MKQIKRLFNYLIEINKNCMKIKNYIKCYSKFRRKYKKRKLLEKIQQLKKGQSFK